MLYQIVISMSRKQKQAIFCLMDAFVAPLAFLFACSLGGISAVTWGGAVWALCAGLVAISALMTSKMGLTRLKLNVYEARGMNKTFLFAASLGLAAAAIDWLFSIGIPSRVFVIFVIVMVCAAITWRIVLRYLTGAIYRQADQLRRVLIYGAGQAGRQLLEALRHDNEVDVLGFVDDNVALQGLHIAGTQVHSAHHLRDLVSELRIDRIILAMPTITPVATARLANRLRNIGCDVHRLPSFPDLIRENGDLKLDVSPVSIHDLLGRSRLERELPGVSHTYQGKCILVTGAGGSIGAELCRQLAACGPKRLVMLDHSELALYQIDKEMRAQFPDIELLPVLGSVMNAGLVQETILDNQIDIILHAAAYKHVPMVEGNTLEGLSNNVLGTKVVADLARSCGVARFILVSTDKAVRPTSIMGGSKRMSELVVQDLAERCSQTLFSMVRFGNVLGSSGSVLPLFQDQIARGGPVTVTHPDVTRFFMTISEAARLVLLAGAFARGGDVFALDMGEPVKIDQLARRMIKGAGFNVVATDDTDRAGIEIRYTGLRPGEKLHEELLITSDMLTTPHPKILRAQEARLTEFELANALRDLRKAIENRNVVAAREVVNRWVEAPDPQVALQQRGA
jgi:FlaA1/EpsC-like NDP-sugar epimerase